MTPAVSSGCTLTDRTASKLRPSLRRLRLGGGRAAADPGRGRTDHGSRERDRRQRGAKATEPTVVCAGVGRTSASSSISRGEDRRRRPVEAAWAAGTTRRSAASARRWSSPSLEDVGELVDVLVEGRGDVQEAAVLVQQVAEVQRALPACRRTRRRAATSTLLPTIAASISALVLIPTTAALCASESKKSARASPASGCAPPRGQTATFADVGEVDAVPLGGVLRVRPDEHAELARALGARPRGAAEPARGRTPTSSGAMNGDEQR